MRLPCTSLLLPIVLPLSACASMQPEPPPEVYAVVVTATTQEMPEWAAVVTELQRKHAADVVVVPQTLETCVGDLVRLQPRYVCFVARPEEVDTQVVRELNKLSRAMDDDPFADFLWGIVTGWTAEDALRIAKTSEPLIVHTSLSTTGVNLNLVDEGLIISDGKKGAWQARSGDEWTKGECDGETSSRLFLDFWNEHDVDLLVTSSHATQVNLEMPFSLGAIVCAENGLYALPRAEFRSWVQAVSRGTSSGGAWYASPACETYRQEWVPTTDAPKLRPSTHPKVFVAAGNCLIGDTMGRRDSMVVTWLSAGGVTQFVGYTVPTWYGKGGWGALRLWQAPAGYITLSEAVFLNNQGILWRLQQENPRLLEVSFANDDMRSPANRPVMEEVAKAPTKDQARDQLGMLYDRDVLALYGDPKWDARFDPARERDRVHWSWQIDSDGVATLTLRAREKFTHDAFPVLLPRRMQNPRLLSADGVAEPVLNDEFVLFPNLKLEPDQDYVVRIAPGEAGSNQ